MVWFLITQWGVSEILLISLIFIYFSRFDTHFHGRKTDIAVVGHAESSEPSSPDVEDGQGSKGQLKMSRRRNPGTALSWLAVDVKVVGLAGATVALLCMDFWTSLVVDVKNVGSVDPLLRWVKIEFYTVYVKVLWSEFKRNSLAFIYLCLVFTPIVLNLSNTPFQVNEASRFYGSK